mgnify:CR=1 FL=1
MDEQMEALGLEVARAGQQTGYDAKERVKVIDFSADPVWQDRGAGSDLHFAAAWTVPVLSMDRSAAGVLVFFRHEASEPLEHEHRLEELSLKYTENHPDVIAAQEVLEGHRAGVGSQRGTRCARDPR